MSWYSFCFLLSTYSRKDINMKNLTKMVAFVLLTIAGTANCSMITINHETEIQALSLNMSFVDFYDYDSKQYSWSSNTGYELNDTIVMFFAEHNNDFALITLVDKPGAGNGGRAKMNINRMQENGSVLFMDDPNDRMLTNGFNWRWNAAKNDGMIYEMFDMQNFALDISFSKLSGLNNGITFLSFDEPLTPSAQFSASNAPTAINMQTSFTVQSQVPEPASIAIFGLALIGLVLRLKRA